MIVDISSVRFSLFEYDATITEENLFIMMLCLTARSRVRNLTAKSKVL
jgi:hypothetical protein